MVQNMSGMLPLIGWLVLLNAISHAAIFFCGWQMVRFIGQRASFNARLKELNRQLTRNLILLASESAKQFSLLGKNFYLKILFKS
jgi:hypothetical protein